MTHAARLLQKAARHCYPANYSGLATRLGISRAVVSAWKTGTENMPEERIVEVARIAAEDPGDWLVLVRSEQTTGEVSRSYSAIAKRYGIAAAAALCAIGIAAFADISTAYGAELPTNAYYVLAAFGFALAALTLRLPNRREA